MAKHKKKEVNPEETPDKEPAPIKEKLQDKPQVKKEVAEKKETRPKEDKGKEPKEKTSPAKNKKVLYAAVGVIILVVLAGVIGAVIWKKQGKSGGEGGAVGKKVEQQEESAEPEVPTTMARKIDGIIVATADANKVPTCVMIENAAFSGVRPQSGLSAASVVYEVIVEGGITRLMAVYAGEQADPVGPVRSARDTYLEFASEYNCAYVHAGGSYTAMTAIPALGIRDIDALRESKWFWRDATKYSPHNLFTNTTNLYEAVATGHSWTSEPTYEAWTFVDDEDLPTGDVANQVNVEFGGSYNVTYNYNAENKYYERTNGGSLHTDSNTGKALSARNIIIQHVPEGEFIEGKGRVNFSVTGEGVVEIIRNGVLTKGKWKKADRLGRTQFFTEDGKEIELVRGNTWVEVVPDGYTVNWN